MYDKRLTPGRYRVNLKKCLDRKSFTLGGGSGGRLGDREARMKMK